MVNQRVALRGAGTGGAMTLEQLDAELRAAPRKLEAAA